MNNFKGDKSPLYLVRVKQAYSDKAIGQILLLKKKEYIMYKDHLELLKIIGKENESCIIK